MYSCLVQLYRKLKIQNANFSTESKSLTEELMKPKTGKRENLSVPGNYLA